MMERLINPKFLENGMVLKKSVYASLLILSFVFLLCSQLVLAEELNLTDKEIAFNCIEQSKNTMQLLSSENFSILRVNDTIKEAEALFDVQLNLEEKGRSTDYTNVLKICEEINTIRSLAFELRDQIRVLEDFYESSSIGIDTTDIDSLFSEIYKEMRNERYELVPPLIEDTYSAIITAQSRLATLNVFYDATTRGLKRFVSENWVALIIGFVVLIILILVLKVPIERMFLKNALEKLLIRKKSLKDMITKNQDLYFNKGKMSEDSFTIKNKKLAELIRDVDRQISLLNEQIYALDHKVKPRKKKK